MIVPRCGIHGIDTSPDEHGNRRCVECDRDAWRQLPHATEAARLIRAVLDADAELGCGSVLVDHDGIDPHALLTEALRALT
jgi:hypothetical protein